MRLRLTVEPGAPTIMAVTCPYTVCKSVPQRHVPSAQQREGQADEVLFQAVLSEPEV